MIRSILQVVINILTHITHVCDGKDHFSLIAVVVTFTKMSFSIQRKTTEGQTECSKEALAEYKTSSTRFI